MAWETQASTKEQNARNRLFGREVIQDESVVLSAIDLGFRVSHSQLTIPINVIGLSKGGLQAITQSP
jgi:hypothetical protein